MEPVIALVGRPNVGKSTLFNRLTRTREALVADVPGLTRDRKYGTTLWNEHSLILVDTGGLGAEGEGLKERMTEQTLRAVQEADLVLFLVDGRAGLNAADESIAAQLRHMGKVTLVVVNKTDGLDPDEAIADFYELALGEPLPVSATHGTGVGQLQESALERLPPPEAPAAAVAGEAKGVHIAVIGRPNVGKSTLVNRMLGEERVVVFDQPGTTRDSIYIPFERLGHAYVLIDTAGVRRRRRVKEAVEKFSVVKTLQSAAAADVVIALLDAREGITDQDLGLLGFVLEAGRALVVGINKWDGLDDDVRARVRQEVERKLGFVGFADIHFISALHGTGVGHLFDSVDEANASASAKLATPRLTQILEKAVTAHPPPLVRGRRIKLRYAHQGGQHPPRIIVHGTQTGAVPGSYRRYLENTFRRTLALKGTPVRIEFRSGENPYRGESKGGRRGRGGAARRDR